MMETVDLMENAYERALPYGKDEIEGDLESEVGESAKFGRAGPYPGHDWNKITVAEMKLPVDAIEGALQLS